MNTIITGRSSGIQAALAHAARINNYTYAAKYMVDAYFHLKSK
jgi:hypothetical protein